MLPLRLRHPEGVTTISVDENGTVDQLLQAIATASGLPAGALEVKAGYPPKPVRWESPAQPFASLKLGKNEQLIVSSSSSATPSSQNASAPVAKPTAPRKRIESASLTTPPQLLSRDLLSRPPPSASAPPSSGEGTYVELDGSYRGSSLVLNVMPDDNSCLFSAVASIFEGGISAAQQLRKVVSAAIRADPLTYSEVMLERSPEEYIRRIEEPKTWGGAIELSIFAAHYKTEIASVEVASGRIDRFGQDAGYTQRCVLVYSGIHYDSCLLSPERTIVDPAFCQTVFPIEDETVLQATAMLAAELKRKHYYTDTATFDLRCGVCGKGLKGEKEASAHAMSSGHTDFREY